MPDLSDNLEKATARLVLERIDLNRLGVVPLDVHNVLDYVSGASMIAAPYVFGFSDVPSARAVCVGLGSGAIGYSACTDYRFSLTKIIPLGVHMGLDILSGLTLASAPYLFGYSRKLNGLQRGVHLALGLGLVGIVAITRSRSGRGSVLQEELQPELESIRSEGHLLSEQEEDELEEDILEETGRDIEEGEQKSA